MNCQSKKKGKAALKRATVSAIVAFSILWIAIDEAELNPVYKPDYQRISLAYVLEDVKEAGQFGQKENQEEELSEQDYETIFRQTGLGKAAVDYIIKHNKDYESVIKKYQKIFFDGYPYTCAKIGLLTYNERMRDENGNKILGNKIIDLQPGDVLVSLSTHTMGYRHGHCGLVVRKPEKGKDAVTIEAVYLGEPTEYQSIKKWYSCPTLVHLRISEEAARSKGYTQEELGKLLVEYAKENCLGIDYGLVPELSNMNSDTIRKTHCSHLIWYIFKHFGYDVDSNGGLIVTPADIAASDLFEIVQIYGIDPDFRRKTDENIGRSFEGN
ncbi:hypothetical protein [Clostridium aminobutyricum]|uniref:Uncharacterized protein n=1 Tax=Clostridium aminobutyricum TaxID=33953 RepID=A0A939II26_CLOAM|nr:hypothetical protein [Clostridium aminobutyricum]MBN7772064.1 hypothetical protein [Clostridium aminobutyricum]